MRNRSFAVLALLLFCAVTATAQTPSLYVPLGPCRLFDSRADGGAPFAAGSTHYLLARGACNVPQAANAIALTAVAFNPAGGGNVKIWESSALQPLASSFNFRTGPGSDSSFLITRLCYPVEECSGEDLAVYVSQATHIIIDIVGYAIPLPPSDPFPAE